MPTTKPVERKKPCGHDDYEVSCPQCALYESDPIFRAAWGGPPLPRKTYPSPAAPVVQGVPSVVGDRRHLLYHIYPWARRGEAWRGSCARLRRRINLFNGRRIIGVATDTGTESLADVQQELSGLGCEFVERENVKSLREVTTFVPLHELVEPYRTAADVVFYGHAKGITSETWSRGMADWVNALYEASLGRWPLARRLLADYPTVGPFLRTGHAFPECPKSSWHFSGSFRWSRSVDLFSHDWRTVPQEWIGVEAHPSLVFGRHEAGCLVHPFQTPGLALYTEEYWDRHARAAVRQWDEETFADRWAPLLLTCVLVSHRKPATVHEAVQSVLNQDCADWHLVVIDSGPLYRELQRYEADPRVRVVRSPHGERCQGWQVNECVRQGLAYGDIVCYLTDDDVYAPGCFSAFLGAARAMPWESAWYGSADRVELRSGGEKKLGDLNPQVVGGRGGESLWFKIDGIQVCHRRTLCEQAPWPEGEDHAVRKFADAHFIEQLGRHARILPLAANVGRHRHTPASEFTRLDNDTTPLPRATSEELDENGKWHAKGRAATKR
jgi:hypothetical protein